MKDKIVYFIGMPITQFSQNVPYLALAGAGPFVSVCL